MYNLQTWRYCNADTIKKNYEDFCTHMFKMFLQTGYSGF